MLRVFLIRHGQTDWNVERRIMGEEPIGLNSTGEQEAASAQGHLAKLEIDALYTSPILRARQTADILLQERSVKITEDTRLKEVGYGDWVGKTFKEVREMPGYVPYYERLHEPVAPKGESLPEVQKRGLEFIDFLQRHHPSGNVVAISHADWIKCLLMGLLEIPLNHLWKIRVDNLSVSLVEWEPRGPRVVCVNQRSDFDRLIKARSSF